MTVLAGSAGRISRSALIHEYRQTIVGELLLAALAIGAAAWTGLSIWSAPDELAIGSAIGAGEALVPMTGAERRWFSDQRPFGPR